MENAFKKYRRAYDQMEMDPAIVELREVATELQGRAYEAECKLDDAQRPYRLLMAEAKKEIKGLVLREKKSVTLFDVEAEFTKGQREIAWKGVAMTFDPAETLLDEYTKTGGSSVTIKALMRE